MDEQDNEIRRQADLENLAKIPLIEQTVNRIEKCVEDYKEIKNDVGWLKGFFWILATAVVSEAAGIIFIIVFRR